MRILFWITLSVLETRMLKEGVYLRGFLIYSFPYDSVIQEPITPIGMCIFVRTVYLDSVYDCRIIQLLGHQC